MKPGSWSAILIVVPVILPAALHLDPIGFGVLLVIEASQAAASSTQAVVQEEAQIYDSARQRGVKVTQSDGAARADSEAKTQPLYDQFYKRGRRGARRGEVREHAEMRARSHRGVLP